jgi:molecular chaperone DnaK
VAEILGIDLGTTKSVGAVWRNGKPEIIKDTEGHTITPSIVALDPNTGEWVVGRAARAVAEYHPDSVIYSIKRLMGRRFKDDNVQDDLRDRRVLYHVSESSGRPDAIEVTLGTRRLTPQEVSAKVLLKIKQDAEAHLKKASASGRHHEITQAVITVPAYFNDSQRQATRDAGRIAGLEVLRVLNEPTAACLAFGYQKLAERRRVVAVYDLGGGTFDVSILEVGQGPFTVRATNGNTHLGGDDIDWLIVDWAMDEILGSEKNGLRKDIHARGRLRIAAEQAKVALSSDERAQLTVPGPLSPASDLHDINLEFTRERLDSLTQQIIERTFIPCRQALQDAQLTTADIKEVLLVGSQTRMPSIHRAVHKFFDREPDASVKPEEAVAMGAAVQAAILAGEATKLRLANVVPLTLGLNSEGNMEALIPRNTPVPIKKTKTYSTVQDKQESVEIAVYQGERPLVKDNVKLASFRLEGIEPALSGEPEIEVTFDVDFDGILHVKGMDKRTGNKNEITITKSVRLSDEEISTMIRNAAEDISTQLHHRLEDNTHPFPDILASAVKAALGTAPLANASEKEWSAYLSTLQGLDRNLRETQETRQAEQ